MYPYSLKHQRKFLSIYTASSFLINTLWKKNLPRKAPLHQNRSIGELCYKYCKQSFFACLTALRWNDSRSENCHNCACKALVLSASGTMYRKLDRYSDLTASEKKVKKQTLLQKGNKCRERKIPGWHNVSKYEKHWYDNVKQYSQESQGNEVSRQTRFFTKQRTDWRS